MPSIGTISATFTTENQAFLRGLAQNRKALQRQQTEFRKAGQQAQRSARQVNRFGAAIAGIASAAGIAAVVRGFTRLTLAASQQGATLIETARATGLQVQQLQLLQRALEADGVGVEQFNRSIKTLQRTITEAQFGLETYARVFNRLGIDVSQAEFALLNTQEQFLLIADALSQIENITDRSAFAQVLFGRGGQAVLATITQGSEGVLREIERQRRLIRPLTADEAQRLKDLRQAYQDVANVLNTSVNRSVASVADEIQRISEQLTALIPRIFRPLEGLLTAFADNFELVTRSITGLLTFLGTNLTFRLLTSLAGLGGFRLVRNLGIAASALAGLGAAAGNFDLQGAFGAVGALGGIGGAVIAGLQGIVSAGRSLSLLGSVFASAGAFAARNFTLAFRQAAEDGLAFAIRFLVRGLGYSIQGLFRFGGPAVIGLINSIRAGLIAGIRGGLVGAAGGAVAGALAELFFQDNIRRRFQEAIDKDNQDALEQLRRGLERYEERRRVLTEEWTDRLQRAVPLGGLNFIDDRRLEIELNQVEKLIQQFLRSGAITADDLVGDLAPLSIIAQEADLIADAVDKANDPTGRLQRLFERIQTRVNEIRETIDEIGAGIEATLSNELIQLTLNRDLQQAFGAAERADARFAVETLPFNKQIELLQDARNDALEAFRNLPQDIIVNPSNPINRQYREIINAYAESIDAIDVQRQVVRGILDTVESINSVILRENAKTQAALIASSRFLDQLLRQSIEGLALTQEQLALDITSDPFARASIRTAAAARQINTELAVLRTRETELVRELDNLPRTGPRAGEAYRVGLEEELADNRDAQDNIINNRESYLDAISNINIREESLLANSKDIAERTAASTRASLEGFNLFDFIQSRLDQLNQYRRELQGIGRIGPDLEVFNFNTEAQNFLASESRRLLEQQADAVRDLASARRVGDAEAIKAAERQLVLAKALVEQYNNELPQAIKFLEQQSQELFDAAATREQLERLADIARGVGDAFGQFTGSIIKNFNDIGDAARRLGQQIVDNLIRNLITTPISNFFTQAIGGIIPGLQNGGLGRGLTLVGEAGPELVDFRNPGRVYSNADLANALDRGSGVRDIVFAPVIQSSDTAAVNRALAEAYPVFETRIRTALQQDARRPSGFRRSLGGR